MRIHTQAGDKPFRTFTFPDGQRHVELLPAEADFREATIEVAIRTADDLFDVLLAKSALDAGGYTVNLDVRYLLGGRMDRRMGRKHPATLEVVCRTINAAGFRRVRLLDAHSEVSLRLLDAENLLPLGAAERAWDSLPMDTVAVAPDAGAVARASTLARHRAVVQASKRRDSATGALSGFAIDHGPPVAGHPCLILDDVCDGGGTFTGLAAVLDQEGATAVYLFVTHALLTKGPVLAGIDAIWTTDSCQPVEASTARLVVLPFTFPATWSGR